MKNQCPNNFHKIGHLFPKCPLVKCIYNINFAKNKVFESILLCLRVNYNLTKPKMIFFEHICQYYGLLFVFRQIFRLHQHNKKGA